MVRYLITGAKGQLGLEMASRIEGSHNKALPFSHRDLDITDLVSVRKCIQDNQPDGIINCASYNAVDQAENDWQRAYLVNGTGAQNLAIAAEEHNIPLVHFSTHFVFSGEQRIPYTLADQPDPISRYGKSKLLGEEGVRSFSRSFLIIRTGWLFGEHGKPSASFPAKLLEWMEKKNTLSIVDDQIAAPSYVPDLVAASLSLLQKKAWGIYHFNNGGSCSRYEWASYMAGKIGWKGTITPARTADFPGGAPRPPYAVLDTFPLDEINDGIEIPHWKDAVDRYIKRMKLQQER